MSQKANPARQKKARHSGEGRRTIKATTKAAMARLHEERRLAYDIDTYYRSVAECFICGEMFTRSDVSPEELAYEIYDMGWRYLHSKKFKSRGGEGIMCAKCVKTPDAKRGE